ncbi:MAG: hypothetical protein ACRDPI_04820 [Nocardioidaceae bacterium]
MRKASLAALAACVAVALSVASYSAPAVGAKAPPPRAGNPNGHAPVPAAARAVDTSHPTHVVGHGTSASCTSAAVVRAVRAGGVIVFRCGPHHKTIVMQHTANVRNDRRANVVIDGGGKVTLSGAGKRRIIYMNTCDRALGISTSHCFNQNRPRLVLQNITLSHGNSTGTPRVAGDGGGGGGAVFDIGGRIKVVNSRFFNNRCNRTGPDVGGAALRVLDQYKNRPVYIVHSTFGGAAGYGGRCSNGGALSSIGVSWVVLNTLISNNRAIGHGANPARKGTRGGGSGAGIYNDGNTIRLTVRGTLIRNNTANEGGGAIFFVSDDLSGTLTISGSRLHHNPSLGFYTRPYPGIFYRGHGAPRITNSTLN